MANSRAVQFVSDGLQAVTYHCDIGYRFEDGTSETTIRCEDGAVWPEMSRCQSKDNLLYIFDIDYNSCRAHHQNS